MRHSRRRQPFAGLLLCILGKIFGGLAGEFLERSLGQKETYTPDGNLAKNIAYKVKRTKRSVSLEPMNPYERRIIHSALQNDKYVMTHSEGEEPFRRVVVTLKK